MSPQLNVKRLLVFALVAVATIAAGKMGGEEEAEPSSDAVVAEVGGEKITEADLDEMLELMNPMERRSYQGPEGRKILLDIWIKNKMLVAEAERLKLHKDPQVQRDLEDARTRILASTYFQRYVAEPLGVSEEEVARYYEAHKDDFLDPARVQLRHLLVESEAEAEAALARIEAGEDFSAVAAEVSIDEYTSHQGGLIGEIREGQPPPFQVGNCENFEAVVFTLEPETPSAATPSDRGYHLFYVDERTEASYPPLEQVTYRIRERILVPESDAIDYFNAHRDEYVVEEGVLARQIVVATAAEARDVTRRARAGEDFEALAKLESLDEPTKNNGGLLGWIRPGGYIQGIGANEEIEAALFAAAEGEVVGPFELDDGFHVFKIDRRREFRQMEFAEVRDRLIAKLLDDRRREYFEQAFVELEQEYDVRRFGWARTYDDMTPEELMEEAETAATPLVGLQGYEKFVERFPDHDDADKALFMAGFLYSEELKDYSTAKDKFRALLASYPDSDYASSATWMLEHMGEEDVVWPPEAPPREEPAETSPPPAEEPAVPATGEGEE
ncbi:MAG: peptidyl-prolyl cis-trans isomerase [Candidatus Coatesbacteria bacterium]|nr:MAG: peptidyl-prolyl cis-trans isomerase [Candidatus Coatesbacteria bacterium]